MGANEKILEAIQILIDSAQQAAIFNKTVAAQITSCENQSTGKYRCKYQDVIFSAYAPVPEIKYTVGDRVYILLTNGSLDGDKIIIGKKY